MDARFNIFRFRRAICRKSGGSLASTWRIAADSSLSRR
jgi:hypothetical protein